MFWLKAAVRIWAPSRWAAGPSGGFITIWPRPVRDLASPDGRATLLRRLRTLADDGLVELTWTLLGAAVGHNFDQGNSKRASDTTGNPERIESVFNATAFQLMGYLAKADGRVSEQEIAAARAVMEHGGKVLMGPHQVPTGEWIVLATDPAGAGFGLVGPKGE